MRFPDYPEHRAFFFFLLIKARFIERGEPKLTMFDQFSLFTNVLIDFFPSSYESILCQNNSEATSSTISYQLLN